MPQFKTLIQQKTDFPPESAHDVPDPSKRVRGRYMRRYNPMSGRASIKKREITKLKSTQSAMGQLDQTLNKFVTRQPQSYGIDIVERKNLNYTYNRVKTEKGKKRKDPLFTSVATLESHTTTYS